MLYAAPLLRSRLGVPHWHARLDLTDLYAFPKPGDYGKSILIMNVHSSARDFLDREKPPGPPTAEPSAKKRTSGGSGRTSPILKSPNTEPAQPVQAVKFRCSCSNLSRARAWHLRGLFRSWYAGAVAAGNGQPDSVLLSSVTLDSESGRTYILSESFCQIAKGRRKEGRQ